METVCAIELRNITKRFGSVVANDGINLALNRGEILSLLGENGSGKTTLMNMLAGIYFPDEGKILVNGEPTTIASPKDAFACGIGMIHQHFKLVDVFSAAENIVLGLDGERKLDLKAASAKILEISEKYGFSIDPNKKIYDMSVSEKQTVEIIKVLYRGADILILDEPTAVLTPQETDRLFDVMRNMKADGKALVIITHKLHEVMDVSDRVAVLRKGRYIGDVATCDTSPQKLTDMMVGHAVTLNIDRPLVEDRNLRLEVKDLTVLTPDGIKALEKELLAQNAEHKDWCCTEELMKTTKDGKALYLHCLPADINGVSCKDGEVEASVFDRYRDPLYKEASYKPYVIAAMIMLAKFADPAEILKKLEEKGTPRVFK